jgi:hypothetical protein
MSAENGVYILVTRGQKRGQKEYRVAYTENITCVYDLADYPVEGPNARELNQKYTLDVFGEARVFTDRKYAEGYARCIADGVIYERNFYLEYGISFINCEQIRFPKGQARMKLRRVI